MAFTCLCHADPPEFHYMFWTQLRISDPHVAPDGDGAHDESQVSRTGTLENPGTTHKLT